MTHATAETAVAHRAHLRAVPAEPSHVAELSASAAAGRSLRLTGGDVRDRAWLLRQVADALTASGVPVARCLTSPVTAQMPAGSLVGVLPADLLAAAETGPTAAWLQRAVVELAHRATVVLVDRAEWLDELSGLVLGQAVVAGALSVLVATDDAADLPTVLGSLDHAGHLASAQVCATERPDRLTRREREIAELARQGLSSQQIARRLHLSVRTVDNHLAHTYAKLGITSRRQLAGRAL